MSDVPSSERTGSLSPGLLPGDDVVVVRKNGTQVHFVVINSSPEILEGRQTDGQLLVSVPVAEIDSVKRREWDALKTMALVVGGILGLSLLVHAVRGVAAAKIWNSAGAGG